MDNQQERSVLTPEFLAGLVTGEGTYNIIIVRGHDKRYKRDFLCLKPNFKIKMTDFETMELVCSTFDSLELPYYRHDIGRDGNKKASMSVEARGLKRAKRHIDYLLPYLTGAKKEAAGLVGAFCDKRLSSRVAWDGYDDEDYRTVERLREVNGIPGANRVSLEILRDYMPRSGRTK